MPGHKLGRGIPDKFLENIAALDITEIPGTDNLHYSSGAILEAQELAARAFGAKRSFFLVNGSTCGIHAMIASTCRPGDKLIISRDCHRSVIGGMMLSGVVPVYILPEFNTDFCISAEMLPITVEKALKDHPDAVGVLLTRPNYYGICCDIEKIAQIVHSHGKILLVDEAHGAHLKFSSRLPVCALDAGADICVQSAHKTLPAFTQGAYLHVNSAEINIAKLEYYLRIIETSSPSYIIMSFLDIAREIMQSEGQKLLNNLLDWIEKFKGSHYFRNLAFLGNNSEAYAATDSTRLTINVSNLGITGYEVETILRKNYGLQVEMSDYGNIVCITSISDTKEDIEYLFSCLGRLDSQYPGSAPLPKWESITPVIPEQKLCLREVMEAEAKRVNLIEAIGRVSKDIIAPYPPGIPVVCPGEVISPEIVEGLKKIISSGGVVTGISENQEIDVV